MATNVIGIFGKTCSAKSDVAREISRMTGNKVKHPGEMITTRARMAGLATGRDVADNWHREVDAETVGAVDALADLGELWIVESGMLDAVLGPRDDVFWVSLHARDDAREARWRKRKEEMGGRSRQIGESVAQRDDDDAALRERLHGADPSGVEPALTIDTSDKSPTDCAVEILAAFQSETGVVVSVARAEMDKSAARGIVPGPSRGVIRSYTPGAPALRRLHHRRDERQGPLRAQVRGRGRGHPGPRIRAARDLQNRGGRLRGLQGVRARGRGVTGDHRRPSREVRRLIESTFPTPSRAQFAAPVTVEFASMQRLRSFGNPISSRLIFRRPYLDARFHRPRPIADAGGGGLAEGAK